MKLVILMMMFDTLEALFCDKEYAQIESSYERGYDITCQGLTDNFINVLQDFQVTNEISLRIENCSFTRVSSQVFHNVKDIKHLTLENSTFTFAVLEPIFQLLEKLEDLKIINTKFVVTKNSFLNLTNLKELTLTNNKLDSLKKGSFNYLSNLVELHITENSLSNLNHVPLCELTKLTNLNFSKNMIEDIGQAFYCEIINRSSGVHINSKHQHISTNSSPIIPTIFSTELYEIDLSYNRIKNLSTSFAFLKSLRRVDIRGNKLTELNNSYFTFLEYLEHLRVDNNSIRFVEDNVFKDKYFLETVDLSNNEIKFLNLKYLHSAKKLYLAGNSLNIDSVLTISDNNTLETIVLDNNNITAIRLNTFKNYGNLKSLHLAKNKIQLLTISFHGLFKLRKLDISSNGIKILPTGVFRDLENLILLDLSKNSLTVLNNSDIFITVKHLEILNLSGNALTNLRYVVVQPLENLEVLDISYNKLHYIDYEQILTNLPLLSNLDVKFNTFPCEVLSKIIRYLQRKQVSYTIQENIDLDKVNVGGIYCIKENVTNNAHSEPPKHNVMFDITLGLIITLVLIVLCIIFFKIHVYLKRRKYRVDEFELLDE